MNSFILLAKIVQNPELRYTQDNQTPIAEMLVEFQANRPEDSYTLKVVGWGNLATEIGEKYRAENQVIIEGRLSIKNYENPDGYKEKKAELIASRIYLVDGAVSAISYGQLQQQSPSTQKLDPELDRLNSGTTNQVVQESYSSRANSVESYSSTRTVGSDSIDQDDIPF